MNRKNARFRYAASLLLLLFAGATSSSLAFASVNSNLTAQYDVLVSSATGSTLSRAAWLVASNLPPSLSCQPQSRSVLAGSNATFTVCASGQPPLSFQWRRNGSALAPATNSPLYTIRSVLPSDAGDYDVVVTNASGAECTTVSVYTTPLMMLRRE